MSVRLVPRRLVKVGIKGIMSAEAAPLWTIGPEKKAAIPGKVYDMTYLKKCLINRLKLSPRYWYLK